MKRFGYTLIELLVAVTLSGVVLSAFLGQVSHFFSQQQLLGQGQKLQASADFALQKLADELRRESVDYEAYASGVCGNLSEQNMADFSAEKLCLSTEKKFWVEDQQLWYQSGTEQAPLTPSSVVVDRAYFWITPVERSSSNPQQPKVSLFLEFSAENPLVSPIILTTTISSRQYE